MFEKIGKMATGAFEKVRNADIGYVGKIAGAAIFMIGAGMVLKLVPYMDAEQMAYDEMAENADEQIEAEGVVDEVENKVDKKEKGK